MQIIEGTIQGAAQLIVHCATADGRLVPGYLRVAGDGVVRFDPVVITADDPFATPEEGRNDG